MSFIEVSGGGGGGAVSDLADQPAAVTPLDPVNDDVTVLQSGAVSLASLDSVRPTAAELHLKEDGNYEAFDDWLNFQTTNSTDGTGIDGTLGYVYLSGTGAQAAQGASVSFQPGVMQVETGSTSTGRCAVVANAALFVWNSGREVRIAGRMQIPVVSTAGQQHETRFGFLNSWSAAPSDGLYFRAQHGDTNWEAVNVGSSTSTVADTGVAIDTSWHVFDIYWNGTTCSYRIDGAEVASQSANPPAVTALFAGFGIYKAAGTSTTTYRSDWMWLRVEAASDRGISDLRV